MGFSSITPVPSLRHHVVDGDTVAHWTFDGDLQDSGSNALHMTVGTYHAAPFDAIAGINCHAMLSGSVYRANDATLRIYTAISVAALVYLRSTPGTNVPIVAMGPMGGGTGSTNNYQYSFEVMTDRTIQYQQQHGSKVTDTYNATGLVVPLNKWCWVAFTRNSAGTTVTLAVDEVTDTTTVTLSDGGTNSDFAIGTKWDATNLDMLIASCIVKNVEVTDLAAWRAETGQHRLGL